MTVETLLIIAPLVGAIAAVILTIRRKVKSDSDTHLIELQVIQMVESLKEASRKCLL